MKRFYEAAAAQKVDGGWTVALDGKPIRTPAKAPFVAPSAALADAAAREWAAQEAEIKPAEMPISRAINTAIDRTGPEYEQVVEIVAAYGGSDLLCYRADGPDGLRARHAAAWDPLLGWAEDAFGAKLITTTGVMHALQPEAALRALDAEVRRHDAFALTGLYDLVAMSGSLVIGLAVSSGRLGAAEAWRASRVDEIWQEEQWGVDEEAAAIAARKAGEFGAAARLLALLVED